MKKDLSQNHRHGCALNAGRWMSYAAAGAVAVGACAQSDDTEAAIYYSGLLNQALGSYDGAGKGTHGHFFTHAPYPPGSVKLQIKTLIANSNPGAKVLGTLNHHDYFGPGPFGQSVALSTVRMWFNAAYHGAVATHVSFYPWVRRVGAGIDIAGLSPFRSARNSVNHWAYIGNDLYASGWAGSGWKGAGTVGYLAFQFNLGSGVQYGRVQLRENTNLPWHDLTLIDYAYGSAGQAIVTGQTVAPEPAGLALLAAGAIGLLAYRRQRPANQSAAANGSSEKI